MSITNAIFWQPKTDFCSAKKLFGGDFLETSQGILTDKNKFFSKENILTQILAFSKVCFFLNFVIFFRAKLVQKVKNYVFHLNYYETEKIKKTKLVWHQILHYVTHLFQNLTNFDRDITKSRISSFSTFSNFCPAVTHHHQLIYQLT